MMAGRPDRAGHAIADAGRGSTETAGPQGFFAPVVLVGARVRLEPLTRGHVHDLERAGRSQQIWRWMPTEHHRPGSMASFIDQALALQAVQKAVVFATIDLGPHRAVGSTRFHCIEPEQLRLEIGVTWVDPIAQRSYVNTEAKFLQLWYAFEILKCRRVELKADAENEKSRRAILRLGAKEEGLFRKHMIYPDGRNRDSVYFALIDDEWPAAKGRLLERLGYELSPRFER